jgi:hypothetical protein
MGFTPIENQTPYHGTRQRTGLFLFQNSPKVIKNDPIILSPYEIPGEFVRLLRAGVIKLMALFWGGVVS